MAGPGGTKGVVGCRVIHGMSQEGQGPRGRGNGLLMVGSLSCRTAERSSFMPTPPGLCWSSGALRRVHDG